MTAVVIILITVLAFLSGFITGILNNPIVKTDGNVRIERRTGILEKEYENFLNYDGSEQTL